MHPIETLARRTVLEVSRFLKVELHTVQFPDGRRIDDWAWLVMPDYAVILARTRDGLFLCFRQVKYAIPEPLVAPPGGYLEPGEPALEGARRELLEETGYEASDWHDLGCYVVDSNRGAGKAHLFLALNAVLKAKPINDDLEQQELLMLSREALERQLDGGQARVLGWAALMSLGFRKLDALAAKE
jgi:ADP-ribose pyrophosphatase